MEGQKNVKVNFVGIVSVLTFVVMGIGSTFAFFTASMLGKADEYISVSSIEVVMNLKVAPLYNGKAILPTNDEDIEKAYQNKCVDLVGSGACIAYEVTLENMGYQQEGIAIFTANSETLVNLKYMLVTDGEDYEILKGPTPAIGASTNDQLEGGVPIKLGQDEDKKIIIVIWLSNLEGPQDEEQGGYFEGQLSFTATSGAKITGTMAENVLLEK